MPKSLPGLTPLGAVACPSSLAYEPHSAAVADRVVPLRSDPASLLGGVGG